MHYNYDALLDAAGEMEQYSGYLDGDDLKASQQVQANFASVRNRFVYDALATGDDPEQIKANIVSDLDMLAEENPGWAGPAYIVRDELVARIEQESQKNPTWRKVVRYTPIALGVIAVAAYFGVKFYNDVDLSDPFESRAGVVARAEALEKTLRHDDWASTRSRRGGFIKDILLWPISPSDAEVNAATQVAGFAFDAQEFMRSQQAQCNYTGQTYGEELSDREIDYLENYAARLQSETVEWDEDPQFTMLVVAADTLGCPPIDRSMFEIPEQDVPEEATQDEPNA